jgi:hypothetical protein
MVQKFALGVYSFVVITAACAQQGSDKSWRFAVSGDSRNCRG